MMILGKIRVFDYVKIGFVFLLAIIVFFHWNTVQTTTLFKVLNFHYDLFTGKIAVAMAEMMGYDVLYSIDMRSLLYEHNFIALRLPYNFYNFFFVLFFTLFLVRKENWLEAVNVLIFSFLLISFRAASKSLIELLYPLEPSSGFHKVMLVWLEPSINLVVAAVLYVVISNNVLFSKVYDSVSNKYKQQLKVSLFTVVVLLIIIPPITRVILTWLFPQFLSALVVAILACSNTLLHLFSYSSYTSANYIYLDQNWISLEHSCLGLGVLTIVFILIFVHKSPLRNKLIFVCFFTVIYDLVNAIRLSALLVHIHGLVGMTHQNVLDLHDRSSQVMYVAAFAGIFLYFFWFSDYKSKFSTK